MTDYSTDAIARRLKQVSEARRLGLSLRQAGRQIGDAAVEGSEHSRDHVPHTVGPRKR